LQLVISQLFGPCDSQYVRNTGYRIIVFPYKQQKSLHSYETVVSL